jgi:hypothetical protein
LSTSYKIRGEIPQIFAGAAQRFTVPAKRDRNAYVLYAATENLRRTPNRAKRAIYGWILAYFFGFSGF